MHMVCTTALAPCRRLLSFHSMTDATLIPVCHCCLWITDATLTKLATFNACTQTLHENCSHHYQCPMSTYTVAVQDFMGFLHLGWEIAAREDAYSPSLKDYGPAWAELSKHVNLTRPGMPAVVRTMNWQPLHLAAMEGKVDLVKKLVQQHGCNMLERSANSWTPMHYAAAHNQVLLPGTGLHHHCNPATPSATLHAPTRTC